MRDRETLTIEASDIEWKKYTYISELFGSKINTFQGKYKVCEKQISRANNKCTDAVRECKDFCLRV